MIIVVTAWRLDVLWSSMLTSPAPTSSSEGHIILLNQEAQTLIIKFLHILKVHYFIHDPNIDITICLNCS